MHSCKQPEDFNLILALSKGPLQTDVMILHFEGYVWQPILCHIVPDVERTAPWNLLAEWYILPVMNILIFNQPGKLGLLYDSLFVRK